MLNVCALGGFACQDFEVADKLILKSSKKEHEQACVYSNVMK